MAERLAVEERALRELRGRGARVSGDADARLRRDVILAFLPLHKRVLGTAVGTATGLLVMAVTAFHLLVLRGDPSGIGLLSEYFYGYTVTWPGLFVGGFWGFFTGFVAGWFAAFCRNFVMAASVFLGRTREELRRTSDFLEHI